MSAVRPRRCDMYRLYARRCRCEKWSFWTETTNFKKLIKNIQVIERYGWQWRVKEVEECCTTN